MSDLRREHSKLYSRSKPHAPGRLKQIASSLAVLLVMTQNPPPPIQTIAKLPGTAKPVRRGKICRHDLRRIKIVSSLGISS